MDFWTAVIIIVSIMAGSSMITAIVNGLKPKLKKKDLEMLKLEIKSELSGGTDAAVSPDIRNLRKRIDQLEEQAHLQEGEIQQLTEENVFFRKLIEEDGAKK